MKRAIKGLLVAALCFGAAQATTHTNKTFLMPRSQLRNKAMEHSTWHRQINRKGDDKFGGSIQLTPFYETSERDRSLGKYFGSRDVDNVEDDPGKTHPNIKVVNAGVPANTDTRDLFSTDIFNNGGTAYDFGGTVRLRPDRWSWGVRLDYYQDLDRITNGLFFKVSTAVVGAEHEMDEKLEDSTPLADRGTNTDIADDNLTGKTLLDFFKGNLSRPAGTGEAMALTHAKIDGSESDTELADIEFMLGYNFLDDADHHIGLNLGVLIPTGNTADGKVLFEPMAGNGGHWAFGGGVDSAFTLVHSGNWILELSLGLDYRFVFEDSERRTVGLLDATTKQPLNHGWYRLLGQVGETALFPAANVTTRRVDVEPGHQLTGLASFGLTWKYFTWDLGYELYVQEAEDVSVKSWDDTLYAIANADFDSNNDNAFEVPRDSDSGLITKDLLDTDAAQTPSQVTHKIYTAMGYAFESWRYPVMFGYGFSYEWSEENDAMDQWAVWGKIGVSF